MDILFIVVPLALVMVGGFVWAFIWMVQGGQLDDLESPALRILHDPAPEHPSDEVHP